MLPRANLEEILPYQASKWLKLPLLLTPAEMKELLALLPEPFVLLSGVIPEGQEICSHSQFLDAYTHYAEQIGRGITHPVFDRMLTCAVSTSLLDFRAVSIPNGVLTRILKPVIQIQPYMLHYSEAASIFNEMTFSPDSFYWGLLFSYPQIFQDPQNQEVVKVTEELYPNTAIFKALRRWSRSFTIPSQFHYGGKSINHHARKGRSWT